MKDKNTARLRMLSAFVGAAAVLSGCRSADTPPDVVVDPLTTGQWVSEEAASASLRITLDSGVVVDIDPGRAQLALSNGGGRKDGTLIMFGKGPAADWYVQLNPSDISQGDPAGCYPVARNAYQIGGAIVFPARADAAPYGHQADFGIRFRMGRNMEPPPANTAPWYGYIKDFCVDREGTVTQVRPPGGP